VRWEIYQGTPEAVAEMIKQTQGKGEINTAFIERINGTFRSCLASLAIRTQSLAGQSKTLQSGTDTRDGQWHNRSLLDG
jgi:hypothetical protein